MSIVQNLLDLIRQEMATHNVSTLHSVKIKHGKLTHVVPEALDFAWEALTRDTEFEGAGLETEEVPLVLKCGGCGREFTPEGLAAMISPCPYCEEQIGHELVSGRELHIEHIEAE
ncbi:hydrogenase maturation nickel metallochaperone HypA [Desulfohalovibrio reitneri]|uniref:hydrogenase maturation nickel metallochaperone HypA/HybF n=1 Tax=Desulfohalovibrio reitneri TaxID=1307759 RepID=UPI0031345436